MSFFYFFSYLVQHFHDLIYSFPFPLDFSIMRDSCVVLALFSLCLGVILGLCEFPLKINFKAVLGYVFNKVVSVIYRIYHFVVTFFRCFNSWFISSNILYYFGFRHNVRPEIKKKLMSHFSDSFIYKLYIRFCDWFEYRLFECS